MMARVSALLFLAALTAVPFAIFRATSEDSDPYLRIYIGFALLVVATRMIVETTEWSLQALGLLSIIFCLGLLFGMHGLSGFEIRRPITEWELDLTRASAFVGSTLMILITVDWATCRIRDAWQARRGKD